MLRLCNMNCFVSAWVIIVLLKEVSTAITYMPSNVAVVQGNDVLLQCLSNKASGSFSTLGWFTGYCTPGTACPSSNSYYDGYVGHTLPNRVTANVTTDGTTYIWCEIIIHQAILTDANIYACQYNLDYSATALAQVVVLAQHPTCVNDKAVAIEHQNITFTCSVSYSGNFGPVMEFNSSSINGNPMNMTISSSVAYTLRVPADRSMAGSTIDCNTYFDQPKDVPPTSPFASNIPSYTYTTSCPVPQILYCPGNCSLTVSECTPGMDITCSAEGNPAPSYIWINMEDIEVISSSALLPGGSILAGHTYTCLASNNVAGGCSCSASCQVASKTTPPGVGNTTPAPVSSTLAIKGSLLATVAAFTGIVSHCYLSTSSLG